MLEKWFENNTSTCILKKNCHVAFVTAPQILKLWRCHHD
jgi:hypothetical protein